MTAARRFVVTVGSSPARVIVEDVRSRRRAVAGDLGAVGAEIRRLMRAPAPDGDRGDGNGTPRGEGAR